MERTGTVCPLCRATSSVVIGRHSRDGSPLTTVLCEGCGLGRTEPLPSPDELRALYRDKYRLLYKGIREPKPYHVLRAARLARSRIARLASLLAARQRMLDVGSGSGEFVYLLGSLGLDAEGIEPNRGYAEYAREHLGLKVAGGLVEEQEFAPACFDGITMFHVLEHVADPVSCLARLGEWLKPGGFLAVEVPNLEYARQLPSHRFHVAHLFHFNEATLVRCGRLAGYACERLEAPGDGGNLAAVLRWQPPGAQDYEPIPGNFERLRRLEERRAAWRYWLSPHTPLRAAARLWRMGEERAASRRFPSRRAILDAVANSLGRLA